MISLNEFIVNFYTDRDFTSLQVEAVKMPSRRLYSLKFNGLPTHSRHELLDHITQKVIPFLVFIDDELILASVSKLPKHILAYFFKESSGSLYTMKIFRQEQLSGFSINIEADLNEVLLEETYELDFILNVLKYSSTEQFLENPAILYFYIEVYSKTIALSKSMTLSPENVYKSRKSLDASTYQVTIVKYKEKMRTVYFVCAYSKTKPVLVPLNVFERDIASQTKLPVLTFVQILKMLHLKNGTLELDPSVLDTLKPLRSFALKFHEPTSPPTPVQEPTEGELALTATIKLQRQYRKLQALGRFKLKIEKTKQQQNRQLIARTIKKLGEEYYHMQIFKLVNGHLLEVLDTSSKCSFSQVVKNPSLYIFGYQKTNNIRELFARVVVKAGKLLLERCDNLQLNTKGYNSLIELRPQTATVFPDSVVTFMKIIQGVEYMVEVEKEGNSVKIELIPSIDSPNITRTFSLEELDAELGTYNTDSIERRLTLIEENITFHPLPAPKLLYKTSIHSYGHIYAVSISTQSYTSDSPDSLLIEASSNFRTFTLNVALKDASNYTGFPPTDLVPLSNFLVKKMLVIHKDSIFLDLTAQKHSRLTTVTKIQALIRGFLTRRRLRKLQRTEIIMNRETLISNEMFLLSAYAEGSHILLQATDNKETLTLIYSNIPLSSIANRVLFLEKVIIPNLHITTDTGKRVLSFYDATKPPTVAPIRHKKLPAPFTPLLNQNLIWREPRNIHGESCLLSIYEVPNANGRLELLFKSTSQKLEAEIPPFLLTDPHQIISLLQVSEDKTKVSIQAYDDSQVVYKDSRFISNKYVNITVFSRLEGFYVTVNIPREQKILELHLGQDINPVESLRKLRITRKAGKDSLIVL